VLVQTISTSPRTDVHRTELDTPFDRAGAAAGRHIGSRASRPTSRSSRRSSTRPSVTAPYAGPSRSSPRALTRPPARPRVDGVGCDPAGRDVIATRPDGPATAVCGPSPRPSAGRCLYSSVDLRRPATRCMSRRSRTPKTVPDLTTLRLDEKRAESHIYSPRRTSRPPGVRGRGQHADTTAVSSHGTVTMKRFLYPTDDLRLRLTHNDASLGLRDHDSAAFVGDCRARRCGVRRLAPVSTTDADDKDETNRTTWRPPGVDSRSDPRRSRGAAAAVPDGLLDGASGNGVPVPTRIGASRRW